MLRLSHTHATTSTPAAWLQLASASGASAIVAHVAARSADRHELRNRHRVCIACQLVSYRTALAGRRLRRHCLPPDPAMAVSPPPMLRGTAWDTTRVEGIRSTVFIAKGAWWERPLAHHSLGFVNHQRSLLPMLFQNKPPQRLVAPSVDAQHLNDDALGESLDTFYAYGRPLADGLFPLSRPPHASYTFYGVQSRERSVGTEGMPHTGQSFRLVDLFIKRVDSLPQGLEAGLGFMSPGDRGHVPSVTSVQEALLARHKRKLIVAKARLSSTTVVVPERLHHRHGPFGLGVSHLLHMG
jgi:hypothetical protein